MPRCDFDPILTDVVAGAFDDAFNLLTTANPFYATFGSQTNLRFQLANGSSSTPILSNTVDLTWPQQPLTIFVLSPSERALEELHRTEGALGSALALSGPCSPAD